MVHTGPSHCASCPLSRAHARAHADTARAHTQPHLQRKPFCLEPARVSLVPTWALPRRRALLFPSKAEVATPAGRAPQLPPVPQPRPATSRTRGGRGQAGCGGAEGAPPRAAQGWFETCSGPARPLGCTDPFGYSLRTCRRAGELSEETPLIQGSLASGQFRVTPVPASQSYWTAGPGWGRRPASLPPGPGSPTTLLAAGPSRSGCVRAGSGAPGRGMGRPLALPARVRSGHQPGPDSD